MASTLIVFILFLVLGIVLNGIRIALGFYQKQSLALSVSAKNSEQRAWIDEAQELWTRPGFFEALSLGRFVADCGALFTGAMLLVRIPGISWGPAFVLASALAYIVTHWGTGLVAKAYAPALGGAVIQAYRIYSWLLMGRVGRWIYELNETLLRRMGYESRLAFLGKEDNGHPDQEGENPDPTGIQEEEREMIRSIFDLRETQAKEIMTPRVDMVALEIGASHAEVMELVARETFSRIPVYEETIDNVRGVFHVTSLLGLSEEGRAGFRLADHLREVFFVPRTKKIGELLREFRRKQVHMAVVVDEYGGVSGLVTLEDVLEEIVGEIHDEDEVQTRRIHEDGENAWLIDPVVSLFDLKEELGFDLRPEDDEIQIDTVGGFILHVHGRVPAAGDVIRHGNLEFEILEMDGNKIERVRMRRLVEDAEDKESGNPEKAEGARKN